MGEKAIVWTANCKYEYEKENEVIAVSAKANKNIPVVHFYNYLVPNFIKPVWDVATFAVLGTEHPQQAGCEQRPPECQDSRDAKSNPSMYFFIDTLCNQKMCLQSYLQDKSKWFPGLNLMPANVKPKNGL